MMYQDYTTEYTPAVDIGWRLIDTAWGKGFAAEGARRCIAYAFDVLEISPIIAICPLSNTASERVMQKIGMTKIGEFDHPKLVDYPDIQRCVCYRVES